MELVILILAIVTRFNGLNLPTPFWVDEFSTASQALKLISFGLSYFSSQNNPELNNIVSNSLVAFSFKLFGISEYTARLPFAIIGSLVPVTLYFISKNYFGRSVALSASLFTAFSYFLIAWSRQARGYPLQQVLILTTIYLYVKLKNGSLNRYAPVLFTISSVIGLLTHSLFALLLFALGIDLIFSKNKELSSHFIKLKKYFFVLIGLFLAILVVFKYDTVFHVLIGNKLFSTNNIWYYHSFLWREYSLVTFLGLTGLGLAFKKYKTFLQPTLIFIGIHMLFLCFVWPPYSSRYLLPLFPILFLGMALALKSIFKFPLALLMITFVILLNGDKFSLKPKQYYSVNHDFREISNIDYNSVYSIIINKGALDKGETAVIDTWHDRIYWYLGINFPHAYWLRWNNEPELINGLPKITNYKIDSHGEKYIADINGLLFIGELKDLTLAMRKYPKGFIFIDDASLPKDVIEFAEKNLRKELSLDRYPLDDNPYSIWPATLYSWGIK